MVIMLGTHDSIEIIEAIYFEIYDGVCQQTTMGN